MNYKDAGVDIEAADKFTEYIKANVKKTFSLHLDNIESSIGGFAGLYKINQHQYLAACNDGVGTKLLLAQELNNHRTIGIDLVAMCANDLICVGAKGLFFLDYISMGKLNQEILKEIMDGVIQGCVNAELALLGGETAEMPDVYKENEYDLAGFSCGIVEHKNILPRKDILEGDKIIGLSASGFHSNGFGLIRKIAKKYSKNMKNELLTPTHIYTKDIQEIQNLGPNNIKAISHMTGGGILNLKRVLTTDLNASISSWPSYETLSDSYRAVINDSKLQTEELFKTFNMGIGLILIVENDSQIIEEFQKNKLVKAFKLGSITKGKGLVEFEVSDIDCRKIIF